MGKSILTFFVILCILFYGCDKSDIIATSPDVETIQCDSIETEVAAVRIEDFSEYYALFDTSTEERNWYHAALGCLFSRPEEIDLNMMFYLGTDNGGWEVISEESRQHLISKEFMWEMDLQVMPVEVLDQILQSTFGITMNDVTIPDEWEYIEMEDAYCSNHNDAYFPGSITITQITEFSDGTVDVFYTVDYLYDARTGQYYENPILSLKLHKTQNGIWHILSNTIG